MYRTVSSGASSTATKLFAMLLVVCLVECVTGSCIKYGHSCWGGHGKRSGYVEPSAPDWYVSKILRSVAPNNDENAIYRVGMAQYSPTDMLNSNEDVMSSNRVAYAKPMLDDSMLSKLNVYQIMREAPEDK